MLGLLDAARVAGEYRNAIERHVDMPQQQRQRTLTDRTEADDHQPPVEFDVFFLVHCGSREVIFLRGEV